MASGVTTAVRLLKLEAAVSGALMTSLSLSQLLSAESPLPPSPPRPCTLPAVLE